MRTILINLSKDTDRLARMSAKLNAASIRFERLDAVYGTNMPLWLKPYFLDQDDRIASKLLLGEVGCYASHLLAMRMVERFNEPCLILEDDLEFAGDFSSVLVALKSLPVSYDIIRLSNPVKRYHSPVLKLSSEYQLIKYSSVPPSAGAYVVTPAGANKFLSWKKLRTLPVDQDLRRIWSTKMVTYGVLPRPVVPDTGNSTIDGISVRPQRNRWKEHNLRDDVERIAFYIKWLGPSAWLRSLFYTGHDRS